MHPWWDRENGLLSGDIGAFLYRHVHSLHHKSYNPGPWSGLSMHPVEHFFYYSCATLPPLFISVHPLHFLYTKFHADIAPIGGHSGMDEPVAGSDYHYLHHAKFECNYGVPFPVNLDKIFGTWVDWEIYKKTGEMNVNAWSKQQMHDPDDKVTSLLKAGNSSELKTWIAMFCNLWWIALNSHTWVKLLWLLLSTIILLSGTSPLRPEANLHGGAGNTFQAWRLFHCALRTSDWHFQLYLQTSWRGEDLSANAGKDATQKFESIWIWSCISAPFQSSSILFRSVLHVSTSVSLCIGHPRYPCRLRGLRFGLQMVSGKHRGFAERLEGPSTASAGCEEVPWVSHVVACGGSLCSRSCVRPLRWLPWWQHETDLGLPREKISANLRCF